MTQLIAIDPNAIERVLDRLAELERKLDQFEIKPRPEWISVAEYARLKNVSPRTVKRRIEAGQLEARGSGKLREIHLKRGA